MNARVLILMLFPFWTIYQSALCFYCGFLVVRGWLRSHLGDVIVDFILACSMIVVGMSLVMLLSTTWGIWVLLLQSSILLGIQVHQDQKNKKIAIEHQEEKKNLEAASEELKAQQTKEKMLLASLRAKKILERSVEAKESIARDIFQIKWHLEKSFKTLVSLKERLSIIRMKIQDDLDQALFLNQAEYLSILNIVLSLIGMLHFHWNLLWIFVANATMSTIFFIFKKNKNL